jgi:predicted dinucleotide-binding enzyme
MKIAIIGAGWLAATVGRAWIKAGHRVLFSSRHPDKQQRAAAAVGNLASPRRFQRGGAGFRAHLGAPAPRTALGLH